MTTIEKNIINPTLIAGIYKNVISAFKKRADVQNGNALGYRKNQNPNGELKFSDTPKSIGDGLSTTGWCVSASQALLLDNTFQLLLNSRGAKAKLISIDIKEQYIGQTYTGHQNKWHTAILVRDNDINFVVDITCAQFGNNFVGKDIWDFETWEKTLRSPLDKHILTDFENSELSYLPKQKNNYDIDLDNKKIRIQYLLNDCTTLTDNEKLKLNEFFTEHISTINTKLIVGNINKFDYSYLNNINKLLTNLDFSFKENKTCYYVMEFPTKLSAKNWIKNLLQKDKITNCFMMFSDSIKESCEYNCIDFENLNKESQENTTYIVLEYINIKGIDIKFIDKCSILIPYGIKLNIDNKDIYNSGSVLNNQIPKKTNTIFVKCMN